MSKKIAGASALLAFAICLLLGLWADNTMSTILSRSLSAMAVTLFVGMIIGTMAEKMMQEHRKLLEARRAAEQAAEATPGDGQSVGAGVAAAASPGVDSASRRKNAGPYPAGASGGAGNFAANSQLRAAAAAKSPRAGAARLRK